MPPDEEIARLGIHEIDKADVRAGIDMQLLEGQTAPD
jgi:hypothetical protein